MNEPGALPAYDANATVREALRTYFAAYGLGEGGYDEPFHIVRILGFLPVLLPNPPARKRALRRHDLNHVLSGYNALLPGEIEIAAFEIGGRGGCGGYSVAWAINLFMFALGILIMPVRLFRAFRRAENVRNAYSLEDVEGSFLDRPLGDVRRELGVAAKVPPSTMRNRLRFAFWGVAALLVTISPFALLGYAVA